MNPSTPDPTGTHGFLFATTPLPGHGERSLPIARALVEHGHEVRWYTGRAHADAITATGATTTPGAAR